MRIGCLQFAPQVGDVNNNLNRADAVLNKTDPDELDLLVLPELAFSGYNFKSLRDISQFLEHQGSGISSLWARTVALKYDCTVVVGYPEKVDTTDKWPTNPEYYNSAIVINGDGETIANYRKTHLFYTDETWALENPEGFGAEFIPGLGNTAFGICVDLNPYKFEAPWDAFEFAFHIIEMRANIVIISMAWMTSQDPRLFSRMPQEPDVETLMYWVSRFEPLIRSENEDEVIVVFANRTGSEDGALYAGTSAVLGVKNGEVSVYGILGRGDKALLIADTSLPPQAKLVNRRPSRGSSRGSFLRQTGIPVLETTTQRVLHTPMDIEHGFQRSPSKEVERGKHRTPKRESAKRSIPNTPNDVGSPKSRSGTPRLSIRTDPSALPRREGSPMVQTPTGPSPTPIALRPRLTIPPTESITMKYLNENMKSPQQKIPMSTKALLPPLKSLNTQVAASQALLSLQKEPTRIIGRDVVIHQAESTHDNSPAPETPMSHFSDSTPTSPKGFWVPSGPMLDVPLAERTWTPAVASDITSFSDGDSSVQGDETHVGPTKFMYQPSTLRRASFQQEMGVDRSTPSGKGYNSNLSEQNKETDTEPQHNSFPQRPASPKSRNASRSRGPERPGSAINPGPELDAITLKLDELVQRINSVQTVDDFASHGKRGSQSIQSVHERTGNLVATLETEALRGADAFTQSDPIAACTNFVGMAQGQKCNNCAARMDLAGNHQQQPLAAICSDRGRDSERPVRPTSNPPKSINITHSRQVSRGRQPGKISTPSKSGHRSITRSANRSRLSVDLSEFEIIEVHTIAHCPLHGSRAPSAASRRAVNGNTNHQSGGRGVETPGPGNAKETDPWPQTVEEPLKPAAVYVSHGPQEGGGSGYARVSVVESMSSSTSSPLPNFGLKTPKAMKLVFDSSPPPVVDEKVRVVGLIHGLGRPRSAVW